MRRSIYNIGSELTLQHGCIFYGASLNGIAAPIWGVVITPRCDLANKKALEVHYLPIIKINEWVHKYLVPLYKSKVIPAMRNKLEKQIKKNPISLDHPISKSSLQSIYPGKQNDKLISDILNFWELNDNNYCIECLKRDKKIYDGKLDELAAGKTPHYELLETWEDTKKDFYVICLTDIRHIEYKTALELEKGIQPRLVNHTIDDLFPSDERMNKYKIVAQLSSPYIEHVCQRLSSSFFRVGIPDWPSGVAKIRDYLKENM